MAPPPRRQMPFPGCNNPSLDNEADHLLAWADGGTTGIANLGQPCPKHHRLKHRSGWTPAGASKDSPPGWISPAGRHYLSEHQDWEPPHWLEDVLPTAEGPDPGLGADPGQHPDPANTGHVDYEPVHDPGRDPEQELPPDPFPDWHHFTDWHDVADWHDVISGRQFPVEDADDAGWPAPLECSLLEDLFLECA